METRDKTLSQILSQLAVLSESVTIHHSSHKSIDSQVSAMYKIIVTGDGEPPLQEIVRSHEKWIREHDAERTALLQDAKETNRLAISNTRDDRIEASAFKRQIWLVVATQLVGFILLGVEIALHMK